jgi:hypothetical protein
MTTTEVVLWLLVWIVGGGALYFLPAIVAFWRQHPQRHPIFWFTVLLGGTGLGWAVALLWACCTIDPETGAWHWPSQTRPAKIQREARRTYREALIPAARLNAYGPPTLLSEKEVDELEANDPRFQP